MSIWQAFWLALLQGATEILPVSSLGHGVILPTLLGWDVNQDSPTFLPFFVVLHLGTAAALFVYFRREWVGVIEGFFRSLKRRNLRDDPEGRLAWLLAAGTIPAGALQISDQAGRDRTGREQPGETALRIIPQVPTFE